uniref:Secreted Juvenile haemolymph binding protein-like protein n=1 Tax=Pristhesancus plagipennis TaxID=1955184 RepID=A0A2K8JM41_PRIPG|nr:secreted Juvenile haemolymph binding protein-like protein [Pristhesancus plagipennis]
MDHCQSFCFLVFLLCLFSVSESKYGRPLRSCRNNELEICIVENMNLILPHLSTGWDRINLPKLDPLILPEKLTASYQDGNMTLDLLLKDTTIFGLADSQVQLVKVKSITEGKVELMCKTPTITALGSYISEGYMSFFPLHSDGQFNVTMSEVNSAWLIYVYVTTINGTEYLTVDHLGLDIMPLDVTVQAAQLLDGDNTLGASLNTYLNENAFELFKMVKPKIMHYFQDIFQKVINASLLSTPKHYLLPEVNIEL